MKKNFNIQNEYSKHDIITPSLSNNASVKREAKSIVQANLNKYDGNGSNANPVGASLKTNVSKTFKRSHSNNTSVKREVKSIVQASLNKYEDSGTSTISVGVSGATYVAKSFELSQYAVHSFDQKLRTFKSNGKSYNIKKGDLDEQIVSIDEKTFTKIKSQSYKSKVTERIKEISSKKHDKYMVKKGLVNGTSRVNVSHEKLKGYRKSKYKGKKITNKPAFRKKILNASSVAVRNSRLMISKSVKSGIRNIESTVLASDDIGTQSLSLGIKGLKISRKTVSLSGKSMKSSYRVVKKSGKAISRTTKGVRRFVQDSKVMGLKNASSKAVFKAIKLLNKSGGSVVNLLLSGVRTAMLKIIMPIILLVIILMVIAQAVAAPTLGVSSLFSGNVSDKDTKDDIDVHAYLTSLVIDQRRTFVETVKSVRNINLIENGGDYSTVRLYNMFNVNEIELTDTNISNSIYSTTEYVELIEPIFQSIMLSEYNLEPSKNEMNDLFDEIWDLINTLSVEELPIEYCYGATVPRDYGSFLADTTTCPNFTSGFHDVFVDLFCCYTVVIDDVPVDECNGYHYCNGHKSLAINISVNGFDALIRKYYTDEIAQLSNKSSLNEEEKERLENLTNYYEFCMAYIETIQSDIGNATIVEIDDISLIPITELACSYIGNPYIYGGNSMDYGIDCSAYVQYLYNQFGVSLPRTASEQAQSGTIILGLENAKAGDLIYWSEDGTDDGIYHVAMYLGNNKVIHASNSKPYPAGGVKVSVMFGAIYKIKRYLP